MLSNKLCVASVLVVFGLVGVSGCSAEKEQPVQLDEPYAGVSAKHVEAQGPAELAGESVVVVRGTTGTPHEGRIRGESRDDWGASVTVVVPVAIESVEAGNLAPAVKDTLYLEMEAPAEQEGYDNRERFVDAMIGREGIFFLSRAPEKASRYVEIVNPDAGRPAGQPLYQATSPEGILITEQDGEGVWSVETGTSFSRGSLEDFLPDRTEFPPSEAADDQDDTATKGLPAQ